MAGQVGTLAYPCRLSGGGKETMFTLRNQRMSVRAMIWERLQILAKNFMERLM